MEPTLQQLKARLAIVTDLQLAGALLYWDQSTYMPPGGAEARARQLATLGRLAHETFTDDATGKLLDQLKPYADVADDDDAALIRVTQHDYERAVQVPASFVAQVRSHGAASYEAWTKARPANDWRAVEPLLEQSLEFSREYAAFFPGHAHVADPLIDLADPGMDAATVRALFADLRRQLVPLVQTITAQPPANDACLRQPYPEDEQLRFGLDVIRRFGYDFERGRQDKTAHPFMTKFGLGDVRITTRVKSNDLGDALWSTMHESGHAMYEQGIRRDFEGTPLAEGASAGVHESQSRLWENLVGRSRPFWDYWYPHLQQTFPQQLSNVSLDTFYRAINKVERSLIRTDADEVTYNLHVMLRFDFELAMLEGSLAVRDLPEAWQDRYQTDLGVAAPDDRDGVLQDVHWFDGTIGGQFQGYTIGNILSAQIWERALAQQPSIPDDMRRGEFGVLHGWLRDNLYQHGRKYPVPDLIERVTGSPLQIEPYMRYLRTKYGELYAL